MWTIIQRWGLFTCNLSYVDRLTKSTLGTLRKSFKTSPGPHVSVIVQVITRSLYSFKPLRTFIVAVVCILSSSFFFCLCPNGKIGVTKIIIKLINKFKCGIAKSQLLKSSGGCTVCTHYSTDVICFMHTVKFNYSFWLELITSLNRCHHYFLYCCVYNKHVSFLTCKADAQKEVV